MRSLRRLSQLSARELWLLGQAIVMLPVVRLALLRIGVADLVRIAERGSGTSQRVSDPQTTARMVRIAAERGLYRAKCLEQSLVLRWLLRRQGLGARIIFGARRDGKQMQAHAWVEMED